MDERSEGTRRITIFTIGHGSRSRMQFLSLLKIHGVELVVDVRRWPRSKIPHFNREELEELLRCEGIGYEWLGQELGGYRRGGYEKYMLENSFSEGIGKLLDLARARRCCIMCLEITPKGCHRRFIARRLEEIGCQVVHIVR